MVQKDTEIIFSKMTLFDSPVVTRGRTVHRKMQIFFCKFDCLKWYIIRNLTNIVLQWFSISNRTNIGIQWCSISYLKIYLCNGVV